MKALLPSLPAYLALPAAFAQEGAGDSSSNASMAHDISFKNCLNHQLVCIAIAPSLVQATQTTPDEFLYKWNPKVQTTLYLESFA